jgi:8-hydroxy-5-deazaflavin:NADPH oxidoreductase
MSGMAARGAGLSSGTRPGAGARKSRCIAAVAGGLIGAMKIGIIGSGRMGAPLGAVWRRARHEVMFSDADPAKSQAAADAAGGGATTGIPPEAAAFGDAILFAPPWPRYEEALRMCGRLDGKILIDVINPLKPDFSGLEIGFDTSVAEQIAHRAPGARVVKAFNAIPSPLLDPANRPFGGQQPSVFICGDDPDAREAVAGLVRDCAFDPVDCGGIIAARYLEPMAMLLMHMVFALKMPGEIGYKFLRKQ